MCYILIRPEVEASDRILYNTHSKPRTYEGTHRSIRPSVLHHVGF